MAMRAASKSGPLLRAGLAARRHASAHAAPAHDFQEFPLEGFKSKLWPFTVAAAITSFIVYRVSARHALEPTAPLEKTEEEGLPAEYEDETKPFLTRYLAYHFPDKRKREQRADEHLRSVLQIKEDKLLVQAAEKQRLRTRRFPQAFEQASPHSIGVGSQTDLSDLKIQYGSRPNLPKKEAEEEH